MDDLPFAEMSGPTESSPNPTTAAPTMRRPTDNLQGGDATTSASTGPTYTRKPRHSQDHLALFRGNRSLFRAWKLKASGKLKADAAAIGTPLDQVIYLFGALDGKAANTVEAYVEHCLEKNTGDPWEVLRRLDTVYGDRNLQSRATTELFSMSMDENETFTDFYPRFELRLSQAGGDGWPAVVCKNALRHALSRKMARAACGSSEPDDYINYVALLKDISVRMELYGEFKHRTAGARTQTQTARREVSQHATQEVPIAPAPDLDIVMTDAPLQLNATRTGPINPSGYPSRRPEDRHLLGKRAQWVSREVYDKRKEEGRCLRCGRDGCRMDRCPLKPALNPNRGRKTQIHATQARPLVTEAAIADDETDSENE